MLHTLAIEKAQWKPLVGSMVTAGLNRVVTTDSQEKRTAGMLRSYNVTSCGDLVVGKTFLIKKEKKVWK